MSLRAAILEGMKQASIKAVEMPKPEEALLNVESDAVCGTDLKTFYDGNARKKYPRKVGLEIAGMVVEAGKVVSAVSVENHLAVEADIPGEWNINEWHKTENIDYAVGFEFDGGFAQYMLPTDDLFKFCPVTHIHTTLYFDDSAPKHHKLAVNLLVNRHIKWEKYISRRFPLEDIGEAYRFYDSRAGLKVAVKPN